jgi:peptidoglycan/xylan/chitin deacetylase (PgdA/CDA1 family)
MNWEVWARIEEVLVEQEIKPLVAVVPDNQDESLKVMSDAPDFWQKVRTWQDRGWTIGLHGYQHHYVTRQTGIVGINPRSEFAGLQRSAQEQKLLAGLEIFSREHVRADAWIAPGHSFDDITLDVLAHVGIEVVSDGFSLFPYKDDRGLLWIPQQLWRFRRMPMGVWTVCLHPNSWGKHQFDQFRRDISAYRSKITDMKTVAARYGARRRSALDLLAGHALLLAIRSRRLVARNRA